MHSFNDIHDFDDAGRASHFSNLNTVNAAPSNRTTLLFPVGLGYNPILSLSSTIDPALLHPLASTNEGLSQPPAFLPVTRAPLLLSDTVRLASGSYDFQSNAPLTRDHEGRAHDVSSCKSNGLGLLLSPDRKSSNSTTTTTKPASPSCSLSVDGLFPDFLDFSSTCFPLGDSFDVLDNTSFVSGAILQESDISGKLSPSPSIARSFEKSTPTFCASAKSESFHASAHETRQRLLSASKGLQTFTGLVVDINMFDKEIDDSLCVKPHELMGQPDFREAQEPRSPGAIKVEDSSDGSVELNASPPAPKYLKAPEPDWPQIPAEHLPLLVERYLAHFASNIAPEDTSNVSQDVELATLPDRSAPLYTPITAELLEAVEEPQQLQDPVRFVNKTTVSRPRTGSRTGGNVMEMYEFLVPQDVALERAHEGVPVVAVVQKTKYFLMMHPGEKLSDDLLFSFAGRLNTSGQQMPGYRCYVHGCSKTTKRKDHMADHVRTHLGEKPFQCSVCGMGFIRNNDCQRHENNHRPDKKFVCSCKAAFSRRDLFVRHQKTVCTMSQGVTVLGCFRRPRKSSKASNAERQGTPDGDDANDFDYVPGSVAWATVSA